MRNERRSGASRFLKGLLLLAGWTVAGWLGYQKWVQPQVTLSDSMTSHSRIDAPVPDRRDEHSTPPGETDAAVERAFLSWQADPALTGVLAGFCVLDEQGRVVYASPLAETALCPASALKTMTTGAAFALLGPEFRFSTTLAATGKPTSDGTLDGDLVLVGSGDPTLALEDLEALAAAVAKAGVKKVNGTVRVETGVFEQPPMSDHWNWGDIGNAYGAGAYGVNVEHNRVVIRFSPGKEAGAPTKLLGSEPALPGVRWINEVRTGPSGSGDQVMVYSAPYGAAITLQGTVPAGVAEFEVTGAIPNPPAVAAASLRSSLEKAGIKVAGREFPRGETREILARHESAPLPEIIDHLHRVSDNLESQCLFYTIGNLKKEDPAESLRKYWEGAGVSFQALRLIDGSGLARATMIRPVDLARVNHLARRGPHGDRFLQSLTASADGTMHSKRGAMSGVKTEVGFIKRADGREYTFALMVNGLGAGVDFWKVKAPLLDAVGR